MSNACPITKECDSRNMMPTDLDATGTSLAGERICSSIPKAADDGSGSTWLYPSPQMFYNAMARKGHAPRPEDMEIIVTIHNMVNEQTWQHVLRWENYYHPGGNPELARFLGRPDDLSPRAWFRTLLLGYQRPFDRHDWYVRRKDGTTGRYVIDFYGGKAHIDGYPAFHIDARPAIDSWQSLYERSHSFLDRLRNRLSNFIAETLQSGNK